MMYQRAHPEQLRIASIIMACMDEHEVMLLSDLQQIVRRSRHACEAHGDIRAFGRWVARSGQPAFVIISRGRRERWVEKRAIRAIVAAAHGVVI